ncbi:FAD-dependent oxidoreductase [Geodermatophilus ruber]|uniref:Thioredoxin reductase (NADPH) n=1 Tax=Geodermatophilus ruber TaxID=504800 RepID=A0A1I4FC83_9ACTN|nr:FAD-dependent oxidoreductase [Geodermatophilus ruber]SFL14487.1 thioredoxin reductase (NADPH) [Geodermatophilus ruber]
MSRPVLLAVDDDGPVLAAVERDLRARYAEHYRVLTASSGGQALDLLRRLRLREEPVALLLVDQRMPGTCGVELLSASRPLHPEARRVLLTAYADTEAAIAAINDAGVQHYLRKPWHPPEERLYPVLDDLLRTWRRPAPVAGLRLLGDRWSPATHALRQFLGRNLVPYRWMDVEADCAARQLLVVAGADAGSLPVLLLDDGEVLTRPEPAEVAGRIGLPARAQRTAYDLVVAGAGPAGLAAGVRGASEGLSTLLLECNAPGGQAGATSRIANYLGVPAGLSGADLTVRAREQAIRLGAEVLVPAEAVGLRRADPYTVVRLADGDEVSASTLVIASGVTYRTLDVPGVDALSGQGVYYGAGRAEAVDHAGGAVYVVGGGNAAGQAAIFLGQVAASVTLLVRGSELAGTMSRYLIDRLEAAETVSVEYDTEVVGAVGTGRLAGLRLRSGGTAEREVDADAVFVFIGQAPRTGWLEGVVRRDERGFVLTGADLGSPPPDWPLDVPPLPLETSVPRVFAAGDVRRGSTKRIASAVAEGAMAVSLAHERLAGR